MFSGLSPEHSLKMILQRQGEVREGVREGSEVRPRIRPLLAGKLADFRLWRLHVSVWVEGSREA